VKQAKSAAKDDCKNATIIEALVASKSGALSVLPWSHFFADIHCGARSEHR
jgi:hypothetical protein